MKTWEEKILILLFLFIYGLIGYATFRYIGAIVFSIVFTFITHVIVWRILYGGELGFKLSPFACHVFDSNQNLIGSFKGDDWYAIEKPQSIMSKRVIKVIRKKGGEEKEEIHVVDYFSKYLEFLDLYVKSRFVPVLTEDGLKDDNPNSAVQMTIEKKIEETLRRTYGDLKLYFKFSNLKPETKELFIKLTISMFKSLLMTGEPLKIYRIISLSNGVFIYWIAHSEPAEYYIYKKKQYFRKWRSWLPWQKGMNVVEMWGVELEEMHEVKGVPLRTLMCLPIQDESYREYKTFVLQKYEVIFSSLSKYIKDILPLLPYFEELELKLTELKSTQMQLDVLKEGIPELYKAVTEMSLLARKAISLASKFAESFPAVSEETKAQLKEFGILTKKIEEKRGIIERVTEKVQSLTKEKPVPPIERREEVVPTEEKGET